MPRVAVEDNERVSVLLRAEEKAMLLRAAALENTDLTDFVLRHALRSAKAIIEEAEHVRLSGRDNLRVLAAAGELLESVKRSPDLAGAFLRGSSKNFRPGTLTKSLGLWVNYALRSLSRSL